MMSREACLRHSEGAGAGREFPDEEVGLMERICVMWFHINIDSDCDFGGGG
ncbi:MAG: hypothetical protein ACI3Z7_02050 [Candidatus Aphodosoma sp.]